MKRKYGGFAIILLISVLFLGCGKKTEQVVVDSGEEYKEKETIVESQIIAEKNCCDFPARYEHQTEKINFMTELVVADEIRTQPLLETSISLQKVEEEGAHEILFKGIETKSKKESQYKNDNGEDTNTTNYVGGNEEALGIYYPGCSFTTEFFIHVWRAFRMEENADKYKVNTDLPFLSTQDAFGKIKENMQGMGIEIGDFYKSYALDYQTMKQEEYAIDMEGNEDKSVYKESWTQEDDSYYFVIWQKQRGLRVHSPFSKGVYKMSEENAPLQVVYRTDGIKYLSLGAFFDFKESNQEIELQPFEKIAETISNKYNMLLGEETYTVTNAELCYITTMVSLVDYKLDLAWILNIEENSTGKSIQNAVNAVTMEEIY